MPVASTHIGSFITSDPAVHGGRAVIAGTVRAIALDNNQGLSPEEIVADRRELNLAQVFAALSYYYANKREIDSDIEAEAQAYDEGAVTAGVRH